MSDDTKTICEWEIENRLMIVDTETVVTDADGNKTTVPINLDESVTAQQFLRQYYNLVTNIHGVDHAARTAFLQANDYEVTRANIIDYTLPVKQSS